MTERQNQQNRQQQQGGQAQSSGQQGAGQDNARQQQQFDTQSRGQQGGGSDSRFDDQIRQHMEVIGDNGSHVGTVDHVDGDRIKLARSDSSDGKHHYVQLSQVAGIEGGKIRLSDNGDSSFGLGTGN